MTCIHYVLITAQCCSRDGYGITSYFIANGDQCDVIAHTRGKASDAIAAPRHIRSLPLITGRAPRNVDCKVHWFKAHLGNLPRERNAGLLFCGSSNYWSLHNWHTFYDTTHLHSYIHTYIYTYTAAHIPAQPCTHIHTHIEGCVWRHMNIYEHAHRSMGAEHVLVVWDVTLGHVGGLASESFAYTCTAFHTTLKL